MTGRYVRLMLTAVALAGSAVTATLYFTWGRTGYGIVWTVCAVVWMFSVYMAGRLVESTARLEELQARYSINLLPHVGTGWSSGSPPGGWGTITWTTTDGFDISFDEPDDGSEWM